MVAALGIEDALTRETVERIGALILQEAAYRVPMLSDQAAIASDRVHVDDAALGKERHEHGAAAHFERGDRRRSHGCTSAGTSLCPALLCSFGALYGRRTL